MRVVRDSAGIHRAEGPFAVGIGIFDGVHRGHQALLRRVLEIAAAEGIQSLAYTFDPHPARLLKPELAPKLIEPLELRTARIDALGIGTLVIEPFTRELASMSAEAFANDVLAGRLGVRHVVVGADFTFGRGRGGNVAKLREWGARLGFEVHPFDIVEVDGIRVSSTKIREFVWAGAMRGASLLLGRPFALIGVVQRGAERGRHLGFGTANIHPRNELLPAIGVYAGRASGTFGTRDAVLNVGYAPTFGGTDLKVEIHLLEYDGAPLYGTAISVDLIDRLRDEIRFHDVDALKRQIQADVAATRRILAATPPPRS